jgi:hypothetical protein
VSSVTQCTRAGLPNQCLQLAVRIGLKSMTFRDLATGLVAGGLFQGKGADPGVLEPFATSATVVSASNCVAVL